MINIKGKIKSIKLVTFEDQAYWSIQVIDMNDNDLGKFCNMHLSSAQQFREQTFSIMKILNNYNVLNIDNIPKNYPIYVDDKEYYISRIANENGDFLDVDRKRQEIRYGKGLDISKLNK